MFLSDVQGDLSGLAVAGPEGFKLHEAFTNRAKTIELDLQYDSFPVTFWFFLGKQGHPIRATVAEMSPLLENQGGAALFGEPALDLSDLVLVTPDRKGEINILAADQLMGSPRLYATFLLWLLSELFEELPEVGNPDKPKLVFFFDEAHLLFDGAPKALVNKVEQVARLIRSKGVGVYFVP